MNNMNEKNSRVKVAGRTFPECQVSRHNVNHPTHGNYKAPNTNTKMYNKKKKNNKNTKKYLLKTVSLLSLPSNSVALTHMSRKVRQERE